MTIFIARPRWRPARKYRGIDREALLRTAANGKAVRVAIHGDSAHKFYNALYMLAWRAGYLLTAQRDGEAFICWTEKR